MPLISSWQQIPEKVVEPGVEVLGEGGHRLVSVEEVGVGGGRDPEADAPRHRLLRVQRLQLRPEQVRREPETAGGFVEDRDQVVGDHVAVCVCN